jgi:hypothetical protein
VSLLGRSLPLLWSGLQRTRDLELGAARLAARPRPGCRATQEVVLDGPSFGVSFLLAAASHVLGVPIPDDVAASAAIDGDGRVSPVGGIRGKTAILAEFAPRVQRLLVHPEDAPRARATADRLGSTIRIVPIANAKEALLEAFASPEGVPGGALPAHLSALGRSEEQQALLVQAFFDLVVMDGRAAFLEWAALRSAAELALREWTTLSGDARQQLRFVADVAARHENNERPVPVPAAEWLAALPAPIRLRMVANVVQQAADAGTEMPDAFRELGQAHRVEGQEAFGEHLMVAGALGRLLAVMGRPDEALGLQRGAARGFLDRRLYGEVARPLAEWYRLAGVLGEATAFEEAEKMRLEVETRAGFARADRPYVTLGRARAEVLLGRAGGEELLGQLVDRSDDTPWHVHFSALRWLAHVAGKRRDEGRRREVLSRLQREGPVDERVRGRFLALAQLDAAVLAGDTEGAARAAASLRDLQPGILAHLDRWASDLRDIALHYPY